MSFAITKQKCSQICYSLFGVWRDKKMLLSYRFSLRLGVKKKKKSPDITAYTGYIEVQNQEHGLGRSQEMGSGLASTETGCVITFMFFSIPWRQ